MTKTNNLIIGWNLKSISFEISDHLFRHKTYIHITSGYNRPYHRPHLFYTSEDSKVASTCIKSIPSISRNQFHAHDAFRQ